MDDVRNFVEAWQTKPSRRGLGAISAMRGSPYGDVGSIPFDKYRNALAAEGSYFMATNPTPGTGIAGIAATGAFSDAESLLTIRNLATVAEGKLLYLDRLRLVVTAAGASGTDHRYASKIEPDLDRYTSGGSVITPVNVNGESSQASPAQIKFGALVTTAASVNARLVGAGLIRPVITVVGDVYEFNFGGEPTPAAHAIAGAAIANIVIPHSPVVLGPGDQFVFSLFATAQTGASSYEFELGYYER